MSAPAIGIDLGTTYSCVAVYRNGRAEIIPNAEGNRITPSYVAFTDTERLVGDAAKSQDALNPTNTIFDAKRLIGRKYDDPYVQSDIPFWPFKVINDEGRPKIEVQYKTQNKTLFPEEVSSMVLAKMKESAEAYLGKKVQNAVITVPAYFNDSQRQATKDAGTIAGLNVLRIINEPTAAALAYGLDTDTSTERNVLIYDLGGGTFDVSVLTIEEGVFEVRSTAGDTHLGGVDFDNNMVLHFTEEFKTKYNRDIGNDLKAIRRLRKACEKAKRLLSSSTIASIDIDSLVDGIDFHSNMTRAKFEELNGKLFRSTLEPVVKALKDAAIPRCDIDEVVLVGGSTRIPMVQRLLQGFFDGRELKKTVNPDEAVALGAAIQAAILDDKPEEISEQIKSLVLVDVTPLSLGTKTIGDLMSVIIPRNTTIPTRKTATYETTKDNQTVAHCEIREGERSMASDNNLLGEFTLEGLPPMPRGQAAVRVTFEIDHNGILQATVVDKHDTANYKSITIKCDKGRLSKQEINKLVHQAERLMFQDKKRQRTAEARNDLEFYCYIIKSKIQDDLKEEVSESDKATVLTKCGEALTWLKEHPKADFVHVWRKKVNLKRIYESILCKPKEDIFKISDFSI